MPVTSPGSLDVHETEDDSERLLAMERNHQQQKQKQRELEFEAGLLDERTQRIQAIESDIIDVNAIMRDLSAMVNQQSEAIGKDYIVTVTKKLKEFHFYFN